MKVAVVTITDTENHRIIELAKAFSRGIASQGHDVDVVDGRLDSDAKLTRYEYIALGTAAPSAFAGKVSPRVTTYLKSSGHLSGKRSYAFVTKKGLRVSRVLLSLMKAMEGEGLYLKRSDIVGSPEEAEAIGARLHIVKTKRA